MSINISQAAGYAFIGIGVAVTTASCCHTAYGRVFTLLGYDMHEQIAWMPYIPIGILLTGIGAWAADLIPDDDA